VLVISKLIDFIDTKFHCNSIHAWHLFKAHCMNVSSVFQPEIKNCSENMYIPVWSTPSYPWFRLQLSSSSSLVQQVTWYKSCVCEVCMQKLRTYFWEKIFSAYVIGVIIIFYISFSEFLSGFLFSIMLCMVCRRRVSIQNCHSSFLWFVSFRTSFILHGLKVFVFVLQILIV
jgi:hypothetical protein